MAKSLKEFLEENFLTVNDNAKLLFEKLNLPLEILEELEEKYGKSDKMSKSKHNIVDPDEMIQKYGADTVRLYVLFAAPPEVNFRWTTTGVEGANRFLNRVWNLVINYADEIKDVSYSKEDFKNLSEDDKKLRKKLHQTIKKVQTDITKNYQFNTAISSIMELVNELRNYKGNNKKVLKEAIENLILLLSLFTPFIADTIWREIGKEGYTINQPFPEVDEDALKEDTVEIPIQINGKVRGKIKVSVDATEEDIKNLVLSSEQFKKWIEGKEIKHIKYVKNRIFTIAVA
ncbi:MAG: hypothetical protein DSY59_01925 [Persephonella sp.]|nr:MAG: hypothetical protein DSY59_01925 [Persephonella sp.]